MNQLLNLEIHIFFSTLHLERLDIMFNKNTKPEFLD